MKNRVFFRAKRSTTDTTASTFAFDAALGFITAPNTSQSHTVLIVCAGGGGTGAHAMLFFSRGRQTALYTASHCFAQMCKYNWLENEAARCEMH